MPTPQRLEVPVTAEDHIQGSPGASVTLVEYGDYQCPHCGRAYPIVKALQRRFADDLRFVYRHFPLIEIHPLAEPAAETAEFAGTHHRFWEMHDLLFENQDELSLALFLTLADDLGLDTEQLADALQVGSFAERINRDIAGALQSGVHGTPTFFINGIQHLGSYEFEDLAFAIEERMGPRRQRRAS